MTPPALRRGFNGFCATPIQRILYYQRSSAEAVEPLEQAHWYLHNVAITLRVMSRTLQKARFSEFSEAFGSSR
jgi:hypothetical protein